MILLTFIYIFALRTGFEPIPAVLETDMLPLHYRSCFADSLGLEPKLQESKSCVLTNYTTNQYSYEL